MTEEEEDMFLQSFGLKSRLGGGSSREESESETPSSQNSTPQSARSKRNSNSMFGSGRLRDYSYLKSISQQKNSRAQSSSSDSLRPVTPESTHPASSLQSSPGDYGSAQESSMSFDDMSPSRPGSTSSRAYGSAFYKRASMAVEQAIKELEEESDEKIVMPRSTPAPRHYDAPSPVEVSAQRNSLRSFN